MKLHSEDYDSTSVDSLDVKSSSSVNDGSAGKHRWQRGGSRQHLKVATVTLPWIQTSQRECHWNKTKKKNSCTYPAHVRRADIRCSDPNSRLSGPLQIVSLRYSSLWLVSSRSARLTLANSLHMMTRGKIALNSSFKLAQLGAESGFRRWNHLVVFRSPEGKNVSVRPVDVRRHFPASPLPSITHWRCQQNSVSNITV